MLQPREADVPVLFLVFVVLPVVAYFLLGRWHDAASKKARVSVLAQRAAEESFRVETMACPDVMPPGPSLRTMPYFRPAPSLRQEFHECATCHAPAKTRCSRCKSVRYCSGKCQIIHWRQGHKETCQKWLGRGSSMFGGSGTEASEQMPFLTNLNSPLPGGDIHLRDMNFDTLSEPSFPTTDGYNLDTDPFPTDRSNLTKSNQGLHMSENGTVGVSYEKNSYNADDETRTSEILSGNKVSNNSFGCADAMSGNGDATYIVKNNARQPSSCAPEIRKRMKSSITMYESSFTTESTRDSFSVVDYGDNAGLDPISSIFGPSIFGPCYAPERPPANFVSCTRFSRLPIHKQGTFQRAQTLSRTLPCRPTLTAVYIEEGTQIGHAPLQPNLLLQHISGAGMVGIPLVEMVLFKHLDFAKCNRPTFDSCSGCSAAALALPLMLPHVLLFQMRHI